MKFLLLTIPLITFSLFASGQLEVQKVEPEVVIGEVSDMGFMKFKLSKKPIKGDTTCFFIYRNAKYSAITDFKIIYFSPADSTVEKLEQVLLNILHDAAFDNEKQQMKITLGNTEAVLSRTKVGKTNYVYFWTREGYFFISEKQINKLFRKQ